MSYRKYLGGSQKRKLAEERRESEDRPTAQKALFLGLSYEYGNTKVERELVQQIIHVDVKTFFPLSFFIEKTRFDVFIFYYFLLAKIFNSAKSAKLLHKMTFK